MSQCIHSFRCVRVCDEVQGQFVWREWNRGDATAIRPDSGTTLLESSCVSCGACADTCPTGAIADKSLIQVRTPVRWTRPTCPYCGVGCELNVGTSAGQIVGVRPVPDAPVSKGHLCVKGRYAYGFNDAPDRATDPMVREGGRFILTWRPERASRIFGVDAQSIRNAARVYAGNRPAMAFLGMGVTEHTQGTDGVMCVVNLALLTGNVG